MHARDEVLAWHAGCGGNRGDIGAVNGLLRLPAVRARFDARAVTPVGGTPQDFAELAERDRQQREDVIERSCARDVS
jgi:hypothetical protein